MKNEAQELLKAEQASLLPSPKESLDINAAMRYVYDQMESAMMTNYVILGEAGKAIKEDQQIPLGDLEVGIKVNQMTPEVISLFKQWGYTETDRGWDTSFEGIPIHFRVIKRKYKFLDNVDTLFYGVDEFHVPNPFDEYFKIKQIVR